MSIDNEEVGIDVLTQEAAAARARLKRDVEVLALKMSPSHLKQEALDFTNHVAHGAKAALARTGERVVDTAKRNPILVTTTAGLGGLLYAGAKKRNRSMLLAALVCGAVAVALALRAKPRHTPAFTARRPVRL